MSGGIAGFISDQLGHQPIDPALFERAFTHSSLQRDSYERLEFLGDRVLGLTIADALYTRYPSEVEGQMSRRYNALVARETCAQVGRSLGIPPLIKLGRQARDDHANFSDNVVGDVVEALLGALFVEAGFAAARDFVLRAWGPFLDQQVGAPQHAKSALQELAAAKGLKAPAYELIARTGSHHAPRFTVKVAVPRLGDAEAEGSTKQEAETAAATALLAKLK